MKAYDKFEELVRRVREGNRTRSAIAALAAQLPAEDSELDELLGEAVAGRDHLVFDALFLASLHAGRRPDARHLKDGGALLADPEGLCAASFHAGGDVGAALVEAVRRGRMSNEREVTALFVAGMWCQREQRPLSAGLIAGARTVAHVAEHNPIALGMLVALGALTGDEGLNSVLRELGAPGGPSWTREIGLTLVERFSQSPLKHLPEHVNLAEGLTMRRAVERIGRNDACPCGSSKKYKRCCMDKDQQRLANSSTVAGVTRDELLAERERYLKEDEIHLMRSYEVARLDPLKLAPGLHVEVIERLLHFDDFEPVTAFFEKLGFRPQLEDVWQEAVNAASRAWKPDILRRLLAVRPAGELPPFEIDLGMRLLLSDASGHLAMINDQVLAGLQTEGEPGSSELVEAAYALLDSPYSALGIVFTRGVLSARRPFDSMSLVEEILRARDRLALPPHDPAEEWLDKLFAGDSDDGSELLEDAQGVSEASLRLEEKVAEVQRLKDSLTRLQREMSQRQTAPAVAPGPIAKAIPGTPAEDSALRELRRKVEDLKTSLNDRHQERNQLRRELLEARSALEAMRETTPAATPAADPHEAQDDDLCGHAQEEFGLQPLRLAEFPRKFHDNLRVLPRGVARAALVLIGRMSAGEPAAFAGVKRLRVNREVFRQRVGGDYRLLFRLHPETLEIVDLIDRRDLQRRIRALA